MLKAAVTVDQIVEFIQEEEKQQRLFEFISAMEPEDKAIVFVSRKAMWVMESFFFFIRNICRVYVAASRV